MDCQCTMSPMWNCMPGVLADSPISHRSSPSQFLLSMCLLLFLLPSLPSLIIPQCRHLHLPDNCRLSQLTLLPMLVIMCHLPTSRAQIQMKTIPSTFLLPRRSSRSNDPPCPSPDHQLRSLPLLRPLLLFLLSPLPLSLLLLLCTCLLLSSPSSLLLLCLPLFGPPLSLPLPPPLLPCLTLLSPLSLLLLQLLPLLLFPMPRSSPLCLPHPFPPLLCPLHPLLLSHLPFPVSLSLLLTPLLLLPSLSPSQLSCQLRSCQPIFQKPAQSYRRTVSRKSKSSMLKPPALRKQQAPLLLTLLTNTPNLPACVNQPTHCRCTRLTSPWPECFLAPSANTSTTMIVTPAYHTTSQRRQAVPPIHSSIVLSTPTSHLQI